MGRIDALFHDGVASTKAILTFCFVKAGGQNAPKSVFHFAPHDRLARRRVKCSAISPIIKIAIVTFTGYSIVE
jgi:hypothetical protein